MSDFYTEVIDVIADWQEIVENPSGFPEAAIDVLDRVVRAIILTAEKTNPGGYHTEIFNIVPRESE